jgi:hypothetical protein
LGKHSEYLIEQTDDRELEILVDPYAGEDTGG